MRDGGGAEGGGGGLEGRHRGWALWGFGICGSISISLNTYSI